jgi:hypothetical protein
VSETDRERPVWLWPLILSGVVFPPLFTWGLVALAEPSPARAGRGTEERPAQAARPPVSLAPLEIRSPREDRLPGDLISDLADALEEGSGSPLVRLETAGEAELFERFREAAGKGLESVTLFRLPHAGSARGYEFKVEDERSLGRLWLEEREGRWRVVGIGGPGAGAAPARAPVGEDTISILRSLLKDQDQEVQKRAAEALRDLQPAHPPAGAPHPVR